MKEKDIRESLMEQLSFKGANVSHFEDQINDYISLWDIKNKLISDIKTRGVVFEDFSSTGIMMMKNNPSTKELLGVNRQMLAILKELGLSTSEAGAKDGGDL